MVNRMDGRMDGWTDNRLTKTALGWRLRALDKLSSDGRTNKDFDFLSSCRSQKGHLNKYMYFYRKSGEILPRLAKNNAHLCPAWLGQENWNRHESSIIHISLLFYFPPLQIIRVRNLYLQHNISDISCKKISPFSKTKYKLTVGKMLAVFRERESPGQVLQSSREEILLL